MKDYYTILETMETEDDIKKSRFIARIYPVSTEEEVAERVAENRKEHYKATHVCYAYVLNTDPVRQKANDDGEPSGTAGNPILEVIHQFHLTDVLVVVIRYFGGTKLGAGGLIRAYSGVATQVIESTPIVKMQVSTHVRVRLHYNLYGSYSFYLSGAGYTPFEEIFEEDVCLALQIPSDRLEDFIAQTVDETSGQAEIEELEESYVAVALS
ncbi:MAG: YigZ family protein [Eubacteriaceae bacterium]|jgi:uncharacterized YigZ family protein|nr:YigZ family protein [Eubacteriaceae bacterium]